MWRVLLIVALIALILLDLSIAPMAILLVLIAAPLSGVAHTTGFLLFSLFWLAISAGLIWLTIRVGRAAIR